MHFPRLLTFALCATASLHAAPPSEFLEIPWGAPVAEAKRMMSRREGASLKRETLSKLQFEGGTFANYPVERYELEMPEGQFARGTVFIEIPSGNAKDGAPLRNHQFEDLYKSLSAKYGKGARSGDAKHTESNWSWSTTDPRSGQKRSISIRLSYSWDPYEFVVSYSNLPATPVVHQPNLKPPKPKDL
jgi:hypothetical protein